MGLIIYETKADHRATAERHFRTVEKQMLEKFAGREKGYMAEVNGWMLEIQCHDEHVKINLMETCMWSVEYYKDIEMAVIQVEINGKKCELCFSLFPILSDEKKIEFIGIRKRRH